MLAILDWYQTHPSQKNDNSTTFCGSYNNSWLLPGAYLAEILIIHCDDFGVPALRRDNITASLSFDFAYKCIEDPESNRVTSDSAYITIEREIDGNGMSSLGHWVSDTARPKNTRYQPQNCLGDDLPQRCTSVMDNEHLDSLSFVWKDSSIMEKLRPYELELGFDTSYANLTHKEIFDSLNRLEKLAHGGTGGWAKLENRMRELDGPKVCVLGHSHSYHLTHAFWLNSLGHRFIWAPAYRAPKRIDNDFFSDYYHKHNCTKFVIGVAQWELGAYSLEYFDGTMTFSRWWEYMSNIVNEETLHIGNGVELEFYFRSIHHNPIGDGTGGCKDGHPGNWWSPTVIEGYNYLLKKIVSTRNNSHIHYIDSDFITYPLWDMSYDWW